MPEHRSLDMTYVDSEIVESTLADGQCLRHGSRWIYGLHLVEALVHQGYKVKALVQYSFSNIGWLSDLQPDILKTVEICSGDIRDRSFINDFCFNADIVFIGRTYWYSYSYVAPQSYVDTNITGTLNILEALKVSTPI